MKTILKFQPALSIGILIAIAFLYACNGTPEKKGGALTEISLQSNVAQCSPSWFPHSQTPAPAEGNGSPFDTSSTTNSIFHEWAVQKFLWATKPLPTGHPLFIDSLTQVTNQLEPVSQQKGTLLSLSDVSQAGSSGILLSNMLFNKQPGPDTIYYSIHANSTLMNTAQSMLNQLKGNVALIANNDFVFPVGSLEMKASWVQASAIPANLLSTFFTMTAYIASLRDTATVALLGIHVVGVVKNHPEFIWATFEHKKMAPNYDWANTTTADVPVTNTGSELLLFAQGASAGVKNIEYNSSATPPTVMPENVFTLFQHGIPRTAKNAFMPNCSQDDASNASNDGNIMALNTCMDQNLKDVWANYFYNGAVWINTDGSSVAQQIDTIKTDGFNLGSAVKGSNARGSLAAFNLTMETFVQTFNSSIYNMTSADVTNCMGCHNAVTSSLQVNGKPVNNANSPLYISHIFRNYLNFNSGTTVSEIERLKTIEFINMVAVKKALGTK